MKQLTNIREQFINSQQTELYQRIQDFTLDTADANLPFSKRLARDNGWAIEYAQRVIDEYKKFVFLAIVAGHPVTPSDQVDQVWHLHLLYTRSYWEDFCLKVLPTQLHHSPTQGGSRERSKFDDWYNKTLASYELFFQESPPLDIWPPSHIRFGRDIHFVRVNTQKNWILPKPQLPFLTEFRLNQSVIFVLSFVLALGVTGCALSDIANLPNLLNFSLSQFTIFYLSAACLGVAVINLIWLFRRQKKPSKIKRRLLLVFNFSLLMLCITKIATGLYTLKGMEFLGFYSLAMVTGFSLDFFARLWAEPTPSSRGWANYTVSWPEFLQQRIRFPRFGMTIKWLTFLSIYFLYFLGISRIILGLEREKPVDYLVVLSIALGIQLLFLLFNKCTEDVYDRFKILLAIPILLSMPSLVLLAFRSLGIWLILAGFFWIISLFTGSNSGGSGGSGSYRSGGSGDSDDGDGDDDGDGCGGCCGD